MRKGDKSLKIYRGCKISKTIKTLMTLFKIEKKNSRYRTTRNRAKPSDQNETPKRYKNYFYASVDKIESEAFDIVIYRPNWRSGYFFDSLKQAFINKFNWGNVSFL